MTLPAYVHSAIAKVEGVASNVKADFIKLMCAVRAAEDDRAEVAHPVEAEGDKPEGDKP